MKLFASDYDGTYFKHGNQKKGEVQANIEMTKKWREQGNIFAFSTGRAICLMGIETKLQKLDYDYIIGLNGAIITSREGKVIFRKTIAKSIVEEIVSLIKTEKIPEFMVSDGLTGYQKVEFNLRNKYWYLFNILKYTKGIFNLSLEAAMNTEVAQVAVRTANHEQAIAFAKKINDKFGEHVIAFPNLVHVDICAKGLSKATGIQHVADLNTVNHEDIYCIGDSFNDLPMIDAYHGFTMIEAIDEIKERAEAVFETVSDAMEHVINK
ncbi:MAG: HAD-IIB family hydrolase [Turicibacter sp.]